MNKELFGITFLAWEYWQLSPLLFGVLILIGWLFKKRMQRVASLVAPGQQSKLLLNFSYAKQVVKLVLYCLSFFFLFLALMRPAWGKKEELVQQEGRELFIALDVSRSMLAQDRAPNRLAFAKAKIKTLVKKLGCERVGLILFSGSTVVQCPLTNDYSAFFMFLDQLDAETISSGTTALDAAIKKALTIFSKMPDKKSKLLVLFTDGEDFSSNLAQVKQDAIQAGMNIFTIGVGTPEGAPIPVVDHNGTQLGHQKDENGTVVISRLNEGILHSLAQESGGIYLRARDDNDDVRTLIARVERFEKEKFEDKSLSSVQERYAYCVVVAFICLLLEWLL